MAKFLIYKKEYIRGYLLESLESAYDFVSATFDGRKIHITTKDKKTVVIDADMLHYSYYTIGGMNNTKRRFI